MFRSIILVTIWLSCASFVLAQTPGKLDQIRDDVRTAPSVTASPASSTGGSDHLALIFDGEYEGGELLSAATIAGMVATSPFWAPPYVCGDDYAIPAYFPRYPYADKIRGLYIDRSDSKGLPRLPGFETGGTYDSTKSWSLRLNVEGSYDLDNLWKAAGSIKFDTTSRFGFTARHAAWFEPKHQPATPDRLDFGDFNLTFRFAQSSRAMFWAGLGGQYLSDKHRTDWGGNFQYGFDWFLKKPFVLSGEFDAGWIRHAGTIRGRMTLGYFWNRCELYGGYDIYRVSDKTLNGPVFGLRLWF